MDSFDVVAIKRTKREISVEEMRAKLKL